MSVADAPLAQEPLAPEPPAPEPPPAPEALTAVRWPLGVAFAIVGYFLALSLVAAGLVSIARRQGWSSLELTLVAGALLFGVYVVQMGVVAWVARRAGSHSATAVGIRAIHDPARWLLAAAGVAVLARLSAGWYAIVLQLLRVRLPGGNIDVLRLLPGGLLGTVLTFALLAIVAPIAEEVVFRGVLLSAIRDRRGDLTAIVVSALVFAAVHINPFSVVPIFVLALGLGWLFVRSRSLWVSIAGHSLFNTIGYVALLFVRTGAAR